MNELVNPSSLAPPAAMYSHGVVSSAGSRLLHTSGVVPTAPDGSVPDGIAAQAALVWDNVAVVLASSGFGVTDVVSITTYVVAGQDLSAVMAARDRALAGHRPASTLLCVSSLARPAWLLEIAVVAAA